MEAFYLPINRGFQESYNVPILLKVPHAEYYWQNISFGLVNAIELACSHIGNFLPIISRCPGAGDLLSCKSRASKEVLMLAF